MASYSFSPLLLAYIGAVDSSFSVMAAQNEVPTGPHFKCERSTKGII